MANTDLTITIHADCSMATDAILYSVERMTLGQRRAFSRWIHCNKDAAFDLNPIWNGAEVMIYPQPSERCWSALDQIKGAAL